MARRQIMDGTGCVEGLETYVNRITGEPGRIKVAVEGGEIVAVLCCWFAACENEAISTEAHPILGQVPICDRCAEKVEAMT